MDKETLLRQWETLGISNDFVFCKVMEDETLLAELIHLILPDLDFTDLTILAQKSEKDGLDTHGVRFDIFVKDSIPLRTDAIRIMSFSWKIGPLRLF